MSANYTYPGQAYAHTLVPLKGWFRETALDIEVAPTANVNINSTHSPITSGLVLHVVGATANSDPYGGPMNGPGTVTVEMGCGGLTHGVPLFCWPGQTDPDISNPGVPSGTPAYGDSTYGPPDHVSVFPPVGGGNMMALVGIGAYELETTEFDTDQTYVPGEPLRAVTSNTNVNAGKVTNQGATSAAFTSSATFNQGNPTQSAWDTVVGVVSRGTYTNANRKPVLAFWSAWLPGTR